ATVFISSSPSWLLRQTRPPPTTCGSIRWMTSDFPSGSSDPALAQRRSTTESPRGPTPITAMSTVSVTTRHPRLATGAWVTVAKPGRQNGRWDDLRVSDRQQVDVVVVGHSDLFGRRRCGPGPLRAYPFRKARRWWRGS